jgi:valyl-tRNA synthetase
METDKLLAKGYEPAQVESKWYQEWLDKGYFHADATSSAPGYTIVIPPPNVTGSLHMGHALNNTLQDVLIRYKRMSGHATLWMPGMDHAGIATQHVVDKNLLAQGIRRKDLGIEKFVEKVWEWKEKYGGVILGQLKRLGCSCDWERTRFTMDAGLSRAVKEVFVRLYEENLIYRDKYIINWCSRCKTALSDLEVVSKEEPGFFYHIKYQVKGTDTYLTIATTRPETMIGDTAVAVNPNDERYKAFIGKMAILPLMNREIPIIGDEHVDLEFGSGVLKVTPGHDFNDFEIGLRHKLESISIFDEDACLNEHGGPYQGMERYACREQVIVDLEKLGLYEGKKPHLHAIGHCQRCDCVVEPRVSVQWFLKTQTLAAAAIKAVEEGKTRILPQKWEKTYFEWLNNIRDWCISRQIWWGHRIPAWYCQQCQHINVAREAPHACSRCGHTDLQQETDVLDTWFSSALWPFSTLGWPEQTVELHKFYPTAVLVTGFDILFFWVARMMMMGLKFMDNVPFHEVYIHGLVRDEKGEKMSKTRGNVIDPVPVMEQYGTDSFRFTLAALTTQTGDVKWSTERVEGYRHFMNKIWNSARFSLMHLQDYDGSVPTWTELCQLPLSLAHTWILSRFQAQLALARQALEQYRFSEFANELYHFVWHEFCDWYLEIVKPALYGEKGDAEKMMARQVLLYLLQNIIKALHPLIPFITEELWSKLPGCTGSIMMASYPELEAVPFSSEVTAKMQLLQDVTVGIRNLRAELNVVPSKKVEVTFIVRNQTARQWLESEQEFILNLARCAQLDFANEGTHPAQCVSAVVNEVEIFLHLGGLIDIEEEKKRLQKEIAKVQKDYDGFQKKIGNSDFMAKAPAEVVKKQLEKAKAIETEMTQLQKRLEILTGL